METIANITVERVPLTSVQPHPRNARKGDIALIAESLEAHGQYAPLVVQTATGYVLKGNHTWRAAESLGWPTIDVVRVDVDDDQATRIMLVDNRASDVGGYDDAGLTALLESLNDDLTGTGYDPGDLDARLAELTVNDNQTASAPEMFAAWEQKDSRTIVLTFTVADHQALCDKLDYLTDAFTFETYSEVVARLVDDAYAEHEAETGDDEGDDAAG